MAQISPESLEEFKKIYCKEAGKEINDKDAYTAASNLVEVFKALMEMDQDQKALERRLVDEPNGFALPAGVSVCRLCDNYTEEPFWYDKWGSKCMRCQEALNKKIVPGYVFKDYDNKRHVTSKDLYSEFGIRYQTLKKLMRQEKLRGRELSGILVFLKNENAEIGRIINNALSTKELFC